MLHLGYESTAIVHGHKSIFWIEVSQPYPQLNGGQNLGAQEVLPVPNSYINVGWFQSVDISRFLPTSMYNNNNNDLIQFSKNSLLSESMNPA